MALINWSSWHAHNFILVQNFNTMATTEEQEPPLTSKKSDATVEVGALKETALQDHVQNVGTLSCLPGNLYGHTNFYIRNSARYVGNRRKFTTYIHFYYMQYVYVAVFLASVFFFYFFNIAVTTGGLNVIFLLFFSQHLYVNIKTMRHVLKQPIMPDHKLPAKNTHLKITMAEFSLKYAQTKKCGIGIVSADGESVQIQVFRRSTMLRMKLCVIFSTISFFVSILMILYCASWPYAIVKPRGANANVDILYVYVCIIDYYTLNSIMLCNVQ